jgi:hypothetical protein
MASMLLGPASPNTPHLEGLFSPRPAIAKSPGSPGFPSQERALKALSVGTAVLVAIASRCLEVFPW